MLPTTTENYKRYLIILEIIKRAFDPFFSLINHKIILGEKNYRCGFENNIHHLSVNSVLILYKLRLLK